MTLGQLDVDQLERAAAAAGVRQQRVHQPARARRAAPDRVEAVAQQRVEVVAELVGHEDRRALGDHERLGELVGGGAGEALDRGVALLELLEPRGELLVAALQAPGGAAAA